NARQTSGAEASSARCPCASPTTGETTAAPRTLSTTARATTTHPCAKVSETLLRRLLLGLLRPQTRETLLCSLLGPLLLSLLVSEWCHRLLSLSGSLGLFGFLLYLPFTQLR